MVKALKTGLIQDGVFVPFTEATRIYIADQDVVMSSPGRDIRANHNDFVDEAGAPITGNAPAVHEKICKLHALGTGGGSAANWPIMERQTVYVTSMSINTDLQIAHFRLAGLSNHNIPLRCFKSLSVFMTVEGFPGEWIIEIDNMIYHSMPGSAPVKRTFLRITTSTIIEVGQAVFEIEPTKFLDDFSAIILK